MRCLLGLAAPSSGNCTVLGSDVSEVHKVIGRVGSIIETPALFPGFSGRRNLQALARISGNSEANVDEMLDKVGLTDRAGDRVRTYSLGMNQRLGLAAALLKDPELLILDEPANGLDPAGLREIRDILRGLAAEGRTVFLSSHLLSEVQLICDWVGIISKGRCIKSGLVSDVLTRAGGEAFSLKTSKPRKAETVIGKAGYEVTRDKDRLVVVAPPKAAEKISKLLADNNVYLSELQPAVESLEDVFLELTGQ